MVATLAIIVPVPRAGRLLQCHPPGWQRRIISGLLRTSAISAVERVRMVNGIPNPRRKILTAENAEPSRGVRRERRNKDGMDYARRTLRILCDLCGRESPPSTTEFPTQGERS